MPKRGHLKRQRPIDSPTAWFAALERARHVGDTRLATRATWELRRLGVEIHFRHPEPQAEATT